MKFVYGKQDMVSGVRAQENCWLLGNGLGGFVSTTGAYSVTRNDHGILIAARTAPNDRVNLPKKRPMCGLIWYTGCLKN